MAWTLDLLKRLNDHAIPYVIIGGVAAITHGSARTTEDIDVCVPLDHATAVRIIRAFKDLHPKWRMRPDLAVIEEDSSNLHNLKNMYLRTDLGQIDILGELPGLGSFDDLAGHSISLVFSGIPCRVLDLETLIKVKEFAGREKDQPALRELRIIRERLRERGK